MNRQPRYRFLLAAGIVLPLASLLAGCQPAAGDGPDASPGRAFGQIRFHSCSLDSGSAQTALEAQCATLEVPEDPDAPDGRRIALNIAWLPATGPAGGTGDPVFFFAGGPGQAATAVAWHVDQALREVRKQRDIVLVDQRGTGGSNPMRCLDEDGAEIPFDAEAMLSEEALLPYARRCLASVQRHADPRHYTTGHAIADFDAVRRALGVETINLVGGSYGTRVAQQYADAYPRHTRSMVLDGVAPNEVVVGGEFDRTFERALRLQAQRCAQDPACNARYDTDLHTRMHEVMDTLRQTPVEVDYHDPRTGELRRDTLTVDSVTALTFFFSYAPETVALLPLLLDEAAHGRYGPLMSLVQFAGDQAVELVNRRLQWSVLCAEDAGRHVPAAQEPGTILGPEVAQMLFSACKVWPAGTPREGHAQPLQSDVPALLLSGGLDPVTPPEYAERVLAGLPNGRHLVLQGQSHGTLAVGCMPKLLAQFIESADAAALDAGCLDAVRPVPAFTSFNGWEP